MTEISLVEEIASACLEIMADMIAARVVDFVAIAWMGVSCATSGEAGESGVLLDSVAHGGSIGGMLPLDRIEI